MRPLNSSIIAGSPWVAALMCLLLGLVTAGPLGGLFGDVPGAWVLGLLLGAAIWLCILWLVTTMLLPQVQIDDAANRLRVRGREYSATAMRNATRSISANASSAYLTYRFTLDDGRRFRLIALGRPFRGLAPEALGRLRSLVSASSIAEPPGLDPEQQRISSALQTNSRAAPVGKAAILSDIDELLGVHTAPTAATRAAAPGLASDPDLLLAEDVTAAELIQDRVAPLFRTRRISAILSLIGVAVLVLLVLSFVVEESVDIAGWSSEHPMAGTIALVGFLLGATGSIAWMLAADAAVRRVRRLADSRWETSDAAARARGLPMPYLIVDASGARRTSTALAFTAAVLAVLGVALAIAALYDDGIRPVLVVGVTLAVVLTPLSIIAWRTTRLDRRTTAERVASRAGERLVGPAQPR